MQDAAAGELEELGVDIVIYTQRQQPTGGRKGTQDDAQQLLEEWQVGGDTGLGAVMFWNPNQVRSTTRVSGVALGSGFSEPRSDSQVDEAVNSAIKPVLASKDFPAALADGLGVIEARTLDALVVPTPTPTRRPAANSSAGPTRPQVAAGQRPTTRHAPRSRVHPSRTPSTACASTTSPRSSAPHVVANASVRRSPVSRSAPARRSSSTRR